MYADDERKGVKQLVAKYRREEESMAAELKRLDAMKVFERKYSGYKLIAGIDEAGRGPLAGPVAAGAVILPKDCEILYLNDSKKLSAAKREQLYNEIKEMLKEIRIFWKSTISCTYKKYLQINATTKYLLYPKTTSDVLNFLK